MLPIPLWTLSLFLLWTPNVGAAPIQLTFTGEVVSVQTKFPGVPFGGGNAVGSLITGAIALDPDTLTSSGPGHYTWAASLSVQAVGGYGFQTPLSYLDITDGASQDSWTATTYPFPTGSGVYATFSLVDSTGAALSSTDYFTPSSLAPWTSGVLSAYLWNPASQNATWSTQIALTGLSVAVPEPISSALVALAMGLLGARRAVVR